MVSYIRQLNNQHKTAQKVQLCLMLLTGLAGGTFFERRMI